MLVVGAFFAGKVPSRPERFGVVLVVPCGLKAQDAAHIASVVAAVRIHQIQSCASRQVMQAQALLAEVDQP
ncbi:hypothetical protein M878_18125 [Streptomyces roseochromogenus subsp. oscitans DS 12.976]|uniref:Uncharacterized protein n=1 Tax=Streptomyces roseochromogenus subsp. oscitans DS 12.976 TaxID=1352936 RepID=V6KEQ5_STRRC|nr:hypothetical protein M878_18125 [Streptomyces roseochromogenus subsp. oscitans DS 12.976]